MTDLLIPGIALAALLLGTLIVVMNGAGGDDDQ